MFASDAATTDQGETEHTVLRHWVLPEEHGKTRAHHLSEEVPTRQVSLDNYHSAPRSTMQNRPARRGLAFRARTRHGGVETPTLGTDADANLYSPERYRRHQPDRRRNPGLGHDPHHLGHAHISGG